MLPSTCRGWLARRSFEGAASGDPPPGGQTTANTSDTQNVDKQSSDKTQNLVGLCVPKRVEIRIVETTQITITLITAISDKNTDCQKHRQTGTQTDRNTDRQNTASQKHRQAKHRQAKHRQTDTQTDTQPDRNIGRQKQTQTETQPAET